MRLALERLVRQLELGMLDGRPEKTGGDAAVAGLEGSCPFPTPVGFAGFGFTHDERPTIKRPQAARSRYLEGTVSESSRRARTSAWRRTRSRAACWHATAEIAQYADQEEHARAQPRTVGVHW